MNMSKLISRIKRDIGIYGLALPIENIDQAIGEIIIETTLRTFSNLHPKQEEMRVDLATMDMVADSKEYREYIITGKNNTPIAEVVAVYPDNASLGGWGGFGPIYTNEMIYQNMLGNAASQLSSLLIPQITFDFIWPNRLRLFNIYLTNRVVIEYTQMHDLSLASIPFTAEESFYKLAVLDVKMFFYNLVKHYNEMQTAHGRIDLHIEDWQDAANKREELVNSWEDTYHLDQKTIYWA